MGSVDRRRRLNSPYEVPYRTYRRLVCHMLNRGASEFVAASLADTALRTHDEKQLWLPARHYGLEPALREATPLWRGLLGLGESIVGGRHEDDPLPDVYAAALWMRIGGDWNLEKDKSIYRGQRCSRWKVTPSLFRPERDGSAADSGARWRRTSAFVAAIRSKYQELSDDQCFAVAQHYSAKEEADTPTHLIDVTWEPLVALFFASLNAVEGDLGIVDHIVVPEWQRLVAAEGGDPGAIRVIEVPVIQRIARQRALFLATPDPDLYERYVPYRIWFRQVGGVVFEDSDIDPPITRASLLPVDQPIPELIKAIPAYDGAVEQIPSAVPPHPLAPGPETLRQRALSIDARLANLDAYNEDVLRTLCEVLWQGPQWAGDSTAKYSLHRLDECIGVLAAAIESGQRCAIEETLQFTLSRLNEASRDRLIALARSTWVAVHGVPVEVITAELVRLVEDIRLVRTKLAGLMFGGRDAHVREVLRSLGEDSRWILVDARGTSDTEIARSLATAPQPQTLLVVMDHLDPLRDPVRRLVRALLDHHHQVDLMGGRQAAIHPASVWVIVCGGPAGFRERRETLGLVPYWRDVDEFRPFN